MVGVFSPPQIFKSLKMSAENIFSRFFYFFTVLAVLAGLFLAYINFPDTVAVHHENNQPAGFLPKNSLFYYMAILVLVVNLLFGVAARVFAKVPNESLRFSEAWLRQRPELNMRIANWTRIAQSFINLIICMALYALAMVNQEDTHKTVSDYQWMLWISALLLIIIVLWLPIRLLVSKPKIST
jgi:hypothetical protein